MEEQMSFAGLLKKLCLLFSCFLLVAATNGNAADASESISPYLFLPAENTEDVKVEQSPFIVRSRLVKVDFELLYKLQENLKVEPDEEHQLILNVFEGLEYTLIIQKIERNRSGSYSWYGQLRDIPMSNVVLVVNENKVYGNISKTNFSYQIRHISDETHAIYKIDPTKFPPTSDPIIPNIKPKSSSSIDPLKDMMNQVEPHISGTGTKVDPHISGSNTPNGGDEFVSKKQILSDSSSFSRSSSTPQSQADDDGSLIDVLVVYTNTAQVDAGGTAAMSSLIDLAASETNAAYLNSGVRHRIRIVGKHETSYAETAFTTPGCTAGDSACFSAFLDAGQLGTIPNVHSLRDSTGADLVVMLVKGDNSLCGLAYLMAANRADFAPHGYSVTARNCATGNFTFGHEIGHNMAARHDRANDNTDGAPFNFNHGYVDIGNNFKTIMGTGAYFRVQSFSNPNVLYKGFTTGVAEGNVLAADNRLTFRHTGTTVARFRDRKDFSTTVSPGLPNSERVLSPYWQSDSGSYSFVAVTHPSLSGMASQIGVVVNTIKNDGTLFGSSTSFTVDASSTTRIFIVREDHPSINSASIPSAQFITGTSDFEHGYLDVFSLATSPTVTTGMGTGDGYRDATMLSFWGAIVVEQSNSGFAMEFIGDMHDTAAAPTFSGANPVSGPSAP